MKSSWEKVINLLSQIIGAVIPPDPKLCVFNVYPNNFVMTADIRALLMIGLLEAKQCIARCWKNKNISAISVA